MRTIQYAIDKETGLTVSRRGSQIAIPILEYSNMIGQNHYQTTYILETCGIFSFGEEFNRFAWTRKIPVEIKNIHRKFWGMKPLKERGA